MFEIQNRGCKAHAGMQAHVTLDPERIGQLQRLGFVGASVEA
jgi:hypothetical protein